MPKMLAAVALVAIVLLIIVQFGPSGRLRFVAGRLKSRARWDSLRRA